MNWQTIFDLPENCRLDANLTKKALMQQADITTSEIKLLQGSQVQNIRLFGKLSRQNGNLRPYEDKEHSFVEILFIETLLQENAFSRLNTKVAQLIHKLIPHHCVVVAQSDDGLKSSLSLAKKRISKNSPNLRVVEKEYFTKIIEKTHSAFLESLRFEKSDTHNQKSYYDYLIKCLNAFALTDIIDNFKIRPYIISEELVALRNQIRAAEEEIEYQKKKLTKDSQMSEKVGVNTEIHQLKQEINNLRKSIKDYE